MAPTRTEACSRRLRRVTSETQRHAGHADIVRELIDGSVGLLDGHHNLRVSERALQREFRDQVQDAARLAGGERSHSAPFWETPGMTKSPLAKAWTDHNTSDPGITVLEVLAYSVAALVGVALVSVWWRRGRRKRKSPHARTGHC